MIYKATSSNWGSVLQQKIFDPLGLNRTGTNRELLEPKNSARPYTTLDNASPVLVGDVKLSDQTLMGAASGARSCVQDLLVYYHAFLKAHKYQAETGETFTPNSPFKHAVSILSPHTAIPVSNFPNHAYCLGWVKAQLPAPMGIIGPNRGRLGETPTIGQGRLSSLSF
jgi:CubicO group peptidase (beta-lactamase class C family)